MQTNNKKEDKECTSTYHLYTVEQLGLDDSAIEKLSKLGREWIQNDKMELANYALIKLLSDYFWDGE